MEHAAKLKRQQIGVLQAFRQQAAAKTPTKPQWSRELLKHRKVQVRIKPPCTNLQNMLYCIQHITLSMCIYNFKNYTNYFHD